MKKDFFNSAKFYYLTASLCLVLTVTGLFLSSNASNKVQNLADIKYGVNLCFTRLTQSVIALQSHDYFSKHLERSYIDFTNECFFEFKEKVLSAFSDVEASRLVDQLLDDSQTFSKALLTLINKRQAEISRPEMQSQVLPAYSKVDFSRFNLNQWVKAKESSSNWWSWQNALFVLFLGFLNAALIFLIWKVKTHLAETEKMETKAQTINSEFEHQPHRLEIFLMQVFEHFQMTKTQEVFKKYSQSLMDQSVILAKMREGQDFTSTKPKVEFAAPEESDWKNADLAFSAPEKNQEEPALQPPSFSMKNAAFESESNNSMTEWTEEDEKENILEDEDIRQVDFSPVSEPVADLAALITTAAKNLSNEGSSTMVTHKASNAPFYLKGDQEHYEQLFIALFNKIEQRFKDFSTPSENCGINIDFHFDTVSSQVELIFVAQGALFHIDDLEYFHDQDHLTVDSYNIIVKEMVKELYGEIGFKNLIGESLEDNSLQITLKVPGKERVIEMQSPKIVQLVRGKKKDIADRMRSKEITI